MDQNPYRSPDSYEIVRRSPSGSKTLIHGRFVGWLYLAVFGLDLILSVVALRAPTFEFASNVASVVDGVFSFAIPFMAYTGYVKPKGLFWALFGFYFLMLLAGFGFGIYVGLRIGPQAAQNVEMNIDFMRRHISYFEPMSLILCVIWLSSAVYASLLYARHNE